MAFAPPPPPPFVPDPPAPAIPPPSVFPNHRTHAGSRSRPLSTEASREMTQDLRAGFPVLMTVANSVRHEFIWVPAGTTFWKLGERVCDAAGKSVNCAADASTATHRTAPPSVGPGRIIAMRVRWSTEPHMDVTWPQMSVVTEHNFNAIMEMLRLRRSVGRFDALECDFNNWRNTIGEGEQRLPSYAEVDASS